MEDFLREKFGQLENGFQDDWTIFEQKLERALFYKRMRVGAIVTTCLILLSIGIFSSSSFLGFKKYYQPQQAISVRPIPAEKAVVISGNEFDKQQASQAHTAKDVGSKQQPSERYQTQLAAAEQKAATSSKQIETSAANYDEIGIAGNVSSAKVALTAENDGLVEQPTKPSRNTPPSLVAEKKNTNRARANQSGLPASNDAQSGSAEDVVTADIRKNKNSQKAGAGLKQASLNKQPENAGATQMDRNEFLALVATKDLNAMNDIALQAHFTDLQLKAPIAPVALKKVEKGPYISPLQSRNPWEYSIKVYPNYTFRKFSVDEDKVNLIHRDFIDQVKTSETGGISLNVGFEISHRVGRATYLNSGIEYISYKTQAQFNFTNYRTANIDKETGAIMSYSLRENPEQIVISDRNIYHYLNLPLSISYKPWASDHIRLNVEGGVSFMYFVTASGKSIDYRTLDIIDISERDYRRSMGSFNIRVGATYYISPQFNLGFEPTLLYFTNTIYTEEYPFKVIPYSVGLNLKLQVKLN